MRHVTELQDVWEHRRSLLNSSELTRGDLTVWDERIKAHLDALLVPGPDAVPILHNVLVDEDVNCTFAAVYALLAVNTDSAAQAVWDWFMTAPVERLEEAACAMACSSIHSLERRLKETVASGPSEPAAAAAEVLAHHGRLDRNHARLPKLLVDECAAVRRTAWRVAAIVDAVTAHVA
jgi:hypothetical protein